MCGHQLVTFRQKPKTQTTRPLLYLGCVKFTTFHSNTVNEKKCSNKVSCWKATGRQGDICGNFINFTAFHFFNCGAIKFCLLLREDLYVLDAFENVCVIWSIYKDERWKWFLSLKSLGSTASATDRLSFQHPWQKKSQSKCCVSCE